eukprot:TRINITY_DN5665_c0_g1_i2.p1 TRINITY_DN5665_c0_g1~~TRINITY_DN5665_c0_g1_i2.p1  ORF type:complete len:598 (-),score=91.67 TRINITY_DN5665_c0_g1_i2:41-1834(-)
MGSSLGKPITSVVVKRHGGNAFRVGMAEMNGFRTSMEDAHVIHAEDSWGFFGVFDGHGGDQCSKYIARRIEEQLTKDGLPPDDVAVKDLVLRLDKEFLDTGVSSGSTGTFVIVKPPDGPGGKYHLRVGNIGDSRVLLGRADGTIFPGPGTDSGLTTDHKPDHPSERERIERTGGHVESVMGVSRVNGDLAVSRAFGDSQHKTTGGPSQCDHPVTADPELQEFECSCTDFLMLVCDGISEGDFPNAEVVKFAAERLKPLADNGDVDPAKAAMAVCHEAIRKSSKDNLSCMIVLLGGGKVPGKQEEFIPGPFSEHWSPQFRKAYSAMAEHAGLTLASALERRLSIVHTSIEKLENDDQDPCDELGGETPDLAELRQELKIYSAACNVDGRAKEHLAGPPGNRERIASLESWLAKIESEREPQRSDSVLDRISQQLNYPSSAEREDGRKVRVAPRPELQPAVEGHEALQWDERLAAACDEVGFVLQEDNSDNTTQVRFPPPLAFKAWLPNCALQYVERVKVAPLEELRGVVQAHPDLTWDEQVAELAGQVGDIIEEDKVNGTVLVRSISANSAGRDQEARCPRSMVTCIEDNAAEGGYAS